MSRTFLVVLLTFSAGLLIANESTLPPCIPGSETLVLTGTSVAGIAYQVPRSQAAAIPLTHLAMPRTHTERIQLNPVKGEFGERLMDSVFTSKVLKSTGGWSQATPFRNASGNGIDGLYLKVDKNGLPRDMLISDAKVNSSKLGMTQTGKQMSRTWIIPRLKQTAAIYREYANQIKNGTTESAGGIAKNQSANRITIPLNDKTNLDVWRTRNGDIQYFCSDKSVTPEIVQRQLIRNADYIDAAADGKIKYRSRLFSYKSEGTQHVIKISQLDETGNTTSSQTVKGDFNELPAEYQKAIKSQLRRTLLEMGKTREEIRLLEKEICSDASKFNQLVMKPKWSWTVGLDKGALKVSGGIAVAAIGIDALMQYARGEINLKQTAAISVVTASSVLIGNYAGSQTSSLLVARGVSQIAGQAVGQIVGGGVASILIAGGMYASGMCSGKQAVEMAAQGIVLTGVASGAGMLASSATLGFAMTFGTASTGTAIASLHGAVATGAAYAWLGGGSIAAGGSGIAGGTALVTGIGTGVGISVVGVVVAYQTYKYFKNEADSHRYLVGIVRLTQERVAKGIQPEWRVAK